MYTHTHTYRKSTQSSRLEGWSGTVPSLPVQFYVSALIQIHTAWELTPPPEVCVCLCVCLYMCVYECPIHHLFVSIESQTPSTARGYTWMHAYDYVHVCLCAHVLHASVYLWRVIHSVHMKLFLINQFMLGQLYELRLSSTPSQ